jgi:hypothetical protein
MSHSSDPEPERTTLSEEDSKLLAQLHANPILAARFRGLLNRFEGEVAAGMDAHQAEEMVIEELDQLGRSIMGQWADTTHEKTLTKTQESNPDVIKSGKKNSSGTPPSEELK